MKRVFTFLLILTSVNLYSQQVSPEVIASAGDHFENEDISISWTLGEPVISTLSGEYILTQGFHQDLYIITSIDEVEIEDFDIQIFPNPTPDYVNISINSTKKQNSHIVLQLFDMNGRLLKEMNKNKLEQSIRINLQSFERANYFLKIIINNQTKTYKILKT